MIYNIEYSHKEKDKKSELNRYYFFAEIEEERIYFYTFGDISGFGFNFCFSSPQFIIYMGTAIFLNMDFIKRKVKEEKSK